MTATAHQQPHSSAARTTLRALHILRAMSPVRAGDSDSAAAPQPFRVNWGVVVTNAIGAVLGLMLTASAGGLAFLVWRLPAQQDQILKNQEAFKATLTTLAEEIKELEAADREQDTRITRLETRR